MTDLPLKHVHRFKDRHGHIRHYFRKPGSPRASLPGLPGSAEFMAAYQAALSRLPTPIGASRTRAGSINALVISYYSSSAYLQLAKVTAATYRNVLERFRRDHGDRLVVELKREHVMRLMDAKAATPAAANALLKMLRVLMRFAVDRGTRRDDPTLGVRKLRYRSEGFRQWTEEDITTFEQHWPSGSRPRLALSLLLYTGQRPGDVSRMGRQHLRAGVLQLTQRKTGTRLALPLHPALLLEMEMLPPGELTFLLTHAGASFSEAGFSQ